MRFAKGYLLIIGVLFYIPFGVLFLIDPAAMFAKMGILFGSDMALEEVRASHGGVWLITGLFCVVSVWQQQWLRYVLVYLLLFNAGFAIGRVVSLVEAVVPAMQLVPLFGFDLILVLVSAVLLSRADLPELNSGRVASNEPIDA
ncbi:MAG: DUF4345 family protein [Immundisolibacteraceae bacterium]|nr:DUF4345 family protein [Immundisolibacteraceae bacterium]